MVFLTIYAPGFKNLGGQDEMVNQQLLLASIGAWIKDNLHNYDFCDRILGGYSSAWKFVCANFAGKCRRRVLLKEFQHPATLPDNVCSECCDVCEKKREDLTDLTEELKILIDVIDTLHQKGEKKIAEWIRASMDTAIQQTVYILW